MRQRNNRLTHLWNETLRRDGACDSGRSMPVREVKSRPILFSGEMVRAILDGRKTQTRRVVHHQPIGIVSGPDLDGLFCDTKDPVARYFACPHGKPGDRLWVRETFSLWCHSFESVGVEYAAGGKDRIVDFPEKVGMPSLDVQCRKKIGGGRMKRPSIFMPKWASRITLEIVSVRVERVQDIGKDGRQAKDVLAEGITPEQIDHWAKWLHKDDAPAHTFGVLWDSINAKRGFGWAVNPWVWKITFKRIN